MILKSSDKPTGIPVPAGLRNEENISGACRIQVGLMVRRAMPFAGSFRVGV